MKKLLFILLALFTLNVYSQKDECEKYFFKQKNNNKSTVFKDTLIKTKYCLFYAHVQRRVQFSFVKDGNKRILKFMSSLHGSGSITRKIILGQNIKIAFIFEDGTNEIITFNGNEQNSEDSYSGGVSGGYSVTYNNIELTDSLLNKMISKKITKFEMKNPFGTFNEKELIQEDLSSNQSDVFIKIANCFYNRINNK